VTVSGDLVEDGVEPPVLLLDRTGARAEVQLGGIPPERHVLDEGFPRRWYLGYSPTGRWFTASLIHMQGVEVEPTLTYVWDLQSPRRPVAVLDLGHEGSAPTLSPDGRTLYSAHYDGGFSPGGGRLVVTDVPSGRTRRVVTADALGVRRVDDVLAQSPDGRTLAVGAGVEVVLVDTASLTPRAHLAGQGGLHALAFSPDGTHLAAGGDRLTVWDVSGDEPVEVLTHDGEADDPAFSSDGTTLYTKTVAGLVQAWDLGGERRFLRARPGDHLNWTNDTFGRLSPDQRKVGYVSNTPRFRVRDVATGELGPVVEPPLAQGRWIDLAWHPDSRVLTIVTGDPVVRTWDSTTGGQLAEQRLAPPPSTEGAAFAWFSLDGKFLLVGSSAGRLHVLDARTLAPTRDPIQVYEKQEGEPQPRALELFWPSGDRRTVWLSDAVVDYVAGTVRPVPDLGFPVVNLSPSPDGKRVLVDTGPTGVGLLDATSLQWISRPSAAQAGLVGGYFTTWSDDGSLVASSDFDGRLSYWDGRTGAHLGTVTVAGEGDVGFSQHNQRLLFAGDDGSVLTWDLDPRSWIAAACRLAGRTLTEQEWRTYLPDRPFQPVCQS
jgi:WD40 repeat protein